jgi:xylose dehydrogenase (NAD/NADP)
MDCGEQVDKGEGLQYLEAERRLTMEKGVLRIGVMGTADIAVRAVIPALKKSKKVETVAVGSRDRERANQCARRFDIPLHFGSYEELLNCEEIDAVYIPLPNSLHFDWTKKAILKGKHVMCEKPLALTGEEVIQMIRLSREKKRYLMEGFMYRFHPRNEEVFRRVREGAIGELRAIESAFSYVLDNSQSYLMNRELGGGALYDVGCYCVNVSRILCGSEPVEVYGTMNISRTNVDVTFSGIIRFPKGVISQFHVSMNEEPNYHYRVVGDRGLIEVPWAFVSFGKPTHIIVQKNEKQETVQFRGVDEYRLEFEHFADAVLTGSPLRYDIEDSLRNSYVIEALRRSSQKGKPVRL